MPDETYYPQEQERKKQEAKAKNEAANNTGEALFDDRTRLNESQAVASVQRESIQ